MGAFNGPPRVFPMRAFPALRGARLPHVKALVPSSRHSSGFHNILFVVVVDVHSLQVSSYCTDEPPAGDRAREQRTLKEGQGQEAHLVDQGRS